MLLSVDEKNHRKIEFAAHNLGFRLFLQRSVYCDPTPPPSLEPVIPHLISDILSHMTPRAKRTNERAVVVDQKVPQHSFHDETKKNQPMIQL